jgi:hypothetical protein
MQDWTVRRFLVFFDLTFLTAGAHGAILFFGRLGDRRLGLGLRAGRVTRTL